MTNFSTAYTDGMDTEIGPISYGNRDNESFQKPFSEKTGEMLDAAVRKMVTTVHEKTRTLLTEHKADVEKLAQLLLEKEVVTRCVASTVLDAVQVVRLIFLDFHTGTICML